jgi:ATP sulfurylase
LVGGKVVLMEHDLIHARRLGRPGDAECFGFYPDFVVDLLEIGDLISIDFNAVLVQVVAKEDGLVTMRVLNGGVMGQNKAVGIDRPLPLPALTEKDRGAIEIGRRLGITNYALSFANCGDDVDLIRQLCGGSVRIISKIECRNGLSHLSEIVDRSDAILIDRGDLSREVPIEQIPIAQKEIIRHCNLARRKVYVATNLLESMIQQPNPTRAEVNDVITTLASGADGLVLAAETAIGVNPIASANMIVRLIQSFEASRKHEATGFYYEDSRSLLVQPHGEILIDRHADERMRLGLSGLRRLTVGADELMDSEQIAVGTYSPLTGFMDRATVKSVLSESRLPSGLVWTMPILLSLDIAAGFVPDPSERILLCDATGGERAVLDVSQVFELDLEQVARSWYGTTDLKHPGVARLHARGSRFVGGEIHLLARGQSPYRHYELTPAQTRSVFVHKGWTRVVGFHTRNPAHRVHEYIQLEALRTTHADGLYISPVIGPTKGGDFLPGPIMQSYQILARLGAYPEGRMVLGSFSTYSRFAGPREAVFTALCRKNMGCSHFIIGRDHAGVGQFYAPNALEKYVAELGDLGIELVRFGPIAWDPRRSSYAPVEEIATPASISGTQVRAALAAGQRLPDWFTRPEIQDLFLAQIAQGQAVFS